MSREPVPEPRREGCWNWLLALAFAVAWLCGCGKGGDGTQIATVSSTQSLCDTYCAYAFVNCRYANSLYGSMDACQATCSTFPTHGNNNDLQGNSVQCRTYYAAAAPVAPLVFCRDAAADSEPCK